jgi:hypothetical protein
MRRFFLKGLFFLVVLSLMLNFLGTFADNNAPLEDWRVEYQEIQSELRDRNDLIEGIALGNSHAAAIDFSVLGIEGQNIVLAAADLFEIEKIVVSLDEKLPRLSTAFVTISLYSFSRDNAKFNALRPRRIRFYSIVPGWSLIEGDFLNFLLGKTDAFTHILSVVRSDNWQGVWSKLFTPSPYANPAPYNGIRSSSVWGICSHYTAEQLDTHALEIAGRNVSSSMQMAYAHPDLEQDSLLALARTIERLQSRGVRVILYTPAYYEKYNLYFANGGSSIVEKMRQAIGKLQQAYGVEYYDFADDPELSTHPELFYNSDHLSECGSRALTTELLKKLNQNNTLGNK